MGTGTGTASSIVPEVPGHTASNDPETFLTEVNDALTKVVQAINDCITAVTHWANDQLAHHGGLIGGIGGGIIAGIPGAVVGGLIGHHEGQALADKLNTAVDKIHEKWKEAEPQIRDAISAILGDPLKMSKIASSYRDAAGALGDVSNESTNASLSEIQFSGMAAGAYETVRGQQDSALKGLQSQLLAAATQMTSDQATLLNYWNQQLWNLFKFIDELGQTAADAANLGNIVTAEAGPVTELIGNMAGAAGDILNAWVGNWIQINVSSAGAWDGLNNGFGTSGLPGGQWPRMGERQRGEMNAPWL